MATTLPPTGSIRNPSSGWAVSDAATIRRRVTAGIIFLCLAFGGLITRLWYLQVVEGASFLAQAQRNHIAHVPSAAPRGLILDRNGEVLATSKAEHSVAIIRGALPSGKAGEADRDRILNTLAFLLGVQQSDIEATLDDARDRGARPFDPVIVAEGVDLRTVTLIEENKPRLSSAVLVADDLKRLYPDGSLACHVLGYTGLVTQDDLTRADSDPDGRDLTPDDRIGKSGVERVYDTLLAGEPGSEDWEVDKAGRPIRPEGSTPAVPGDTLKLTLDANLQRAAEAGLADAKNNGAVAVIDPRDGSVLALASRPTFDPNIFSLPRSQFPAAYRELADDPNHPFQNRPVSSRFPPGSTFKMVTAAAALQSHAINTDFTVDCEGGMRLGRWFGCWQHHGPDVDLFKAFADSCDTFFYQASLRLGNPESSGPTYLAQVARQFGLGHRTGIDLTSDEAGLIPDPAWRARINANHPDLAVWYPGNTLNMAIGQGDVLTTPLQMAMVTAAVANGGTLWTPHVMSSLIGPNGQVVKSYAAVGRSVGIDDGNLALIREGMRDVVTTGTGKGCALPQVEIAGKTGSAEDQNHGLPHAWWVCFAPYDKPTIAIAVLVENSGHGAENSAPIAKRILEAAFPAPAAPAPR